MKDGRSMGSESFPELFERWKRWSETAVHSEDGWESDFPEWDALMAAAKDSMCRGTPDGGTIAALAECWAASEEDEPLAEFARENHDACWASLEALATSNLAACRWQVYDVVANAGSRSDGILRRGLVDPDPYARRRAVLALARIRPRDAHELAESFMNDPDPYIRQAAIEMVLATEDPAFRKRALKALGSDPVEHVRLAAEGRLP